MFVRWLLPVVAAFTIVFASAGTLAAAGVSGTVDCCCPKPESCKCRDHGDAPSTPTMKRCRGDATIALPELAAATLVRFEEPTQLTMQRAGETPWLVMVLEHWYVDPETPPF